MIKVIDNFIKDTRILSDIEWESSFWNSRDLYHYFKGTPANTLKKRIINYIWDKCPVEQNTLSYEYWTHVISEVGIGHCRKKLGQHIDKDEIYHLMFPNKPPQRPNYGCIYYPVENDIEGGELVIHADEEIVIEPKKNRLVWFPSGQYHHEVRTVTKGIRYSMAINSWEYENHTMLMGSCKFE